MALNILLEPFQIFTVIRGNIRKQRLISGVSDTGDNLHNFPANGKHGPIPEEMFQTLLTNKKKGNLD
jgi:hypothetical protein